jgi:uncharacterized protein YbcI
MVPPRRTPAQRIAAAAAEDECRRTGRAPHAVSVVLGGETLVVTLHGALSPAEQTLALTPTGAAELQAYRRRLFDTSAAAFRREIRDITGVEIRESAEVEPTTGTAVTVFTTGTVVQVFLLTSGVATDAWSGGGSAPTP